jgi:hypothetical protein
LLSVPCLAAQRAQQNCVTPYGRLGNHLPLARTSGRKCRDAQPVRVRAPCIMVRDPSRQPGKRGRHSTASRLAVESRVARLHLFSRHRQTGQASREGKSSLCPACKLRLVSPNRNVQPIGNCNCLSLAGTFCNALVCLRVEHQINPDSHAAGRD